MPFLPPNQQRQSTECSYTQNKNEKLKPGLFTFYDIRPGNRAGLFSKEKIKVREEISKEKEDYFSFNEIFQRYLLLLRFFLLILLQHKSFTQTLTLNSISQDNNEYDVNMALITKRHTGQSQ